MEEAVLSAVGLSVTFSVTYWLGRRVGLRYRKMKRWLASAAYIPGVLAGTIVCTLGAIGGRTSLWATGLGLMGGSLVGLRHGHVRADDERKAALKAQREAADAGSPGGEVS